MTRPVATLADLSGGPQAEQDPRKRAARVRARSELWEELALLGVEVDDFDGWLAARVAAHAAELRVRDLMPPRAEELAELRALAEQTQSLARSLAPRAMTPRVHAGLLTVGVRNDVSWPELREQMHGDAVLLAGLLRAVLEDMVATPPKRGRKAQHGADELLAEIVERLKAEGLRVGAARVTALQILRAEGLAAPSAEQREPEKAVARAARRVRK